MNRFKASKFKNTTPKIPKKDEWISDVRAGSAASCGNHIKSSCSLIAFNTEQGGGGVLGLVSLDNGNEGKRSVSQLHCHADLVTDFDFSPFDDFLLATCSADETVKVWRLPESGQTVPSSPGVTLSPGGGRVENVLFHPTADGVLATSAGRVATVWDAAQQSQLAALEDHGDQIQSLSWKQDGSLIATSCKDKKLRIFDPRAQLTAVQNAQGLQNNKDSRVIWIGDTDNVLCAGFNQMREREVRVWDARKMGSSVGSVSLDTSPGTLIPLFDPDTGLLVLAGMGDCVMHCFEVTASQPVLSQVSQCLTEAATRGIAMVPKLAVDVTSCEVVRVLQLTDSFIVPVSYSVPRKSGQDFHGDLYPDTPGDSPALPAEEWWSGGNKQVKKVSLDPAKRPIRSFSSAVIPCSMGGAKPEPTNQPTKKELPIEKNRKEEDASGHSSSSSSLTSPTTPSSLVQSPSTPSEPSSGLGTSCSQRSLQNILGPSSKLRHTQSLVLHRDTHITNLKGLNLTTPGECDGFCVNSKRVAVPLASAGGQIAVLELSQPGRLPDSAIPTIQNGVAVADFSWDPFEPRRLAVAGEDAKIRVWLVPEGGLKETISEPQCILQGHTEKIYSVKFHPLASGIIASSSYDLTVRLWDLGSGREVRVLHGHQDQIFSLAWSPDGQFLATVSKDRKVRIYDPRKSTEPTQEGPGPEGARGARLVWVCAGKYLLVSGFDSRSERQIYLYAVGSLSSGPLATVSTDVSPSTLIPFYDEDTSTAFLTGKGDTRVYVYEITPESPHFLECSSFNSSDPHKAFSFLPKLECDVREVEFAKALRLSKTSIEPVVFRAPRVKKEYFQDDLFPETAVWWEPALSASAWLSGSNGQHRKISLQPKGMTPVSEAPKEAPVRKYAPSSVYLEEKSDEQKKDELLSAMVAKLGNREDPLPQESFEGVDDDEWDD
ncbi:coronin-7-like isoform X1 [Acipenser ruthenus]|uniref:coronin-7-like isoform X1 n=1 Tax=Acipenser ruthenus TaxID=7906 RepID=UPI0027420FBF|nr:coronin-7-like isoform X1 [Acipenser ruthenus]